MAPSDSPFDFPWYAWALLTVICWGVYGVCMHTGSASMVGDDNQNAKHARIMAFLWVGLAYFLTAVIAPLIILKINGGPMDFWAYPAKGLKWSLIAGILGAIGALGVLLAFGASPNPPIYVPIVMSIIFAGAPIVNAIVNTTKEGNWAFVKPPFILGICLAALGGYLVTQNPPKPPPAEKPAASEKAN
jgi:hypothetical protein